MSIFMADTVERPSPKAKRMLLAKRFGNRFSTGNALREQHANTLTWIKCEPPDAVVFAASTPEVIEVVKLCAEAARGGDPLRHEHLARRADQCAVRRHPARSLAYEPHRASGDPELRGRARRHAQGAQRSSARSGPVLRHPPRRRCKRRHGRDQGLRQDFAISPRSMGPESR